MSSDRGATPDPAAPGSGRATADTPGPGDAPYEPTWGGDAGVRRDPVGRMGGVSSLAWSLTRDDAPNLHPGVPYTAQFITKVGRFAKVDPRKHGRLWNRWRWLGLLFWGAIVGGSFAKAWKDVGGLPSTGGGADEQA